MSGKESYERAFPDVNQPKKAYISHGLPFTEACKKHIDETFHAKRVYIVVSGGLSRSSDALTRLTDTLGDKVAAVHIGVGQHTPFTDVVAIAREVNEKKADCILTLGGGSLSDAAKLIVFVAANPHHMSNIMGLYDSSLKNVADYKDIMKNERPGINDPTVPIICVPTSLSAGEYSRFSGATNPETHVKYQFFHPLINPDLVVLDPALTTTTPEWVWISTGVRAVDHCVEALCMIEPHAVVDKAAAEALSLLVPGLLQSKKDPADLTARLNCQLAARKSMTQLLMGVGAGASHGIGHMLGPLGVGHGQTSCILLPAVMKYNKPYNAARQETVKTVLWEQAAVAKVLAAHGLSRDSSDAGDALRAIFDELQMPRSLKDVGVGPDKYAQLAKASLLDPLVWSNPRPMTTEEDVMEVINAVKG